MRGRAGLLLAAGLVAGLTLMAEAAVADKAGERPEDMPIGAGNWSGSKSEDEIRSSAKPGKQSTNEVNRDVPVPRPKPGSKAAKAEAEAAKKKAAAEAEEAGKKSKAAANQKDGDEDTAAVPAPKTKPKKTDDKPVQAGLVTDAAESDSAPYRGNMAKDEIKKAIGRSPDIADSLMLHYASGFGARGVELFGETEASRADW